MQKYSRALALGTVVLFCMLWFSQLQKDGASKVPSSSSTSPQGPILAESPEEPQIQRSANAGSARSLKQSTQSLLTALNQGHPISLAVGNSAPRRFLLRPRKVTTDDFSINIGGDTPFAADFHTYDGRSIGTGFKPARIALAIVDDSVAAMVTEANGSTLQVRTDPQTGTLQTLAVAKPEYTCRPGVDENAPFAMDAPVYTEEDWQMGPAARLEPLAVSGDDPATGDLTRTLEFTPWGPRYDQSLKDAMLVIVLDKEAAGDTSSANIASKTSQYLAVHSNVATIYEYQLGIRMLLQEFIMIPNTGAYTAVSGGTPTADGSLNSFENWMDANRPIGTYRWTTAALWDSFSSGGTVGLANVNAAATSTGLSTNKVGKTWAVAGHEIGHNFGARHTVGTDGIMMASLSSSGTNTRSFFSLEQTSGETGAFIVYQDSGSKLTGPATYRNPKEMPFANDDTTTTPVNTAVTISPLNNDDLAAAGGSSNTVLTLVETSQVLPVGAGSAAISGSNLIFTPANGFTGTAWFSYTIQGDLGNEGQGWLHKADIAVIVRRCSIPGSQSDDCTR